jgi:SAM-dependent methyltransferase
MTTDADTIRETVRDRYAESARRVSTLPVINAASCCGGGQADPVTSNLYGQEEIATLPGAAYAASLGCGNPTALATLNPGETVLDLGSGGGIDVLLSARRVGPEGFAYGLDMTDEMLALAEKNRAEAGAENVRFLKGQIEDIPLEEAAVDVIISNCVINLSADKAQVLREAFRVLKPGGRFAVSDVVTRGELPADLKADMEAWVGCIAGALDEREYRSLLADAGFEDIEVQVTRTYDPRELAASFEGDAGCCGSGASRAWDAGELERFEASGGQVMSAFVRARKPVSA